MDITDRPIVSIFLNLSVTPPPSRDLIITSRLRTLSMYPDPAMQCALNAIGHFMACCMLFQGLFHVTCYIICICETMSFGVVSQSQIRYIG